MTDTPTRDSVPNEPCWLGEWRRLIDAADQSVYEAVADTATPRLDRVMVNVSNAANHSRLWLATAAAMATLGGRSGRRAAVQGVLAVALASAVTNLALKPLARRRRPAVPADPVPDSRRVRRPGSSSFPSGHAASAFAFASAAGQAMPRVWLPLHAAAAAVAFSRVHTGVHYTSDVVFGALIGDLCGHVTGWRAAGSPRRGGTGGRTR
jgi:membrane-associated phospholipid phosphatase